MEELIKVQGKVRVKKDQTKNGIQFKYRTAEGILEVVKPLCIEEGLLLTLSDNIVNVGGSNYIESVVSVSKGGKVESAKGLAKEPDKLMSMSAPQITGSCSSYARKTALCGLFAIDDSDDPDGMNTRDEEATPEQYQEIINLKRNMNPQQIAYVDKAVKGGLTKNEANQLIENIKRG